MPKRRLQPKSFSFIPMNKFILFALSLLCAIVSANAQIGYQVALTDTNGKPRANATVTVSVTITANNGVTLVSQTQSSTTNAQGVLSLTVGNSGTFSGLNAEMLPLWVGATVDGVSMGRTQILNVPVAEYAKKTDELSKDLLTGKTWKFTAWDKIFTINFTQTTMTLTRPASEEHESGPQSYSGRYVISSYMVCSPFGIFAYDKDTAHLYGMIDDAAVDAY